MPTKGASNRYGNTNGSKHNGQPTEHINYAWAKDFNKKTLDTHYKEHGKTMGFESKESYKQHSIKYANTVDRKNCKSFVDSKTGATYKYNVVTNELAIITKNGYVVTYFKPKGGYDYYKSQIKSHTNNKGDRKK